MSSATDILKAEAVENRDHSQLYTKNVDGQMFLMLASELESSNSDNDTDSCDSADENDCEVVDSDSEITLSLLDEYGQEMEEIELADNISRHRDNLFPDILKKLPPNPYYNHKPVINISSKSTPTAKASAAGADKEVRIIPVVTSSAVANPTYIIKTSVPLTNLDLKALFSSGNLSSLVPKNLSQVISKAPITVQIVPKDKAGDHIDHSYFSAYRKIQPASSTPSTSLPSQKPATTYMIGDKFSSIKQTGTLSQKPSSHSALLSTNKPIIHVSASQPNATVQAVGTPTATTTPAVTNQIEPLSSLQNVIKTISTGPNRLISNVQNANTTLPGTILKSPVMSQACMLTSNNGTNTLSTQSLTSKPIIHSGSLLQSIAPKVSQGSRAVLAPKNDTMVQNTSQSTTGLTSLIPKSSASVNSEDSNSNHDEAEDLEWITDDCMFSTTTVSTSTSSTVGATCHPNTFIPSMTSQQSTASESSKKPKSNPGGTSDLPTVWSHCILSTTTISTPTSSTVVATRLPDTSIPSSIREKILSKTDPSSIREKILSKTDPSSIREKNPPKTDHIDYAPLIKALESEISTALDKRSKDGLNKSKTAVTVNNSTEDNNLHPIQANSPSRTTNIFLTTTTAPSATSLSNSLDQKRGMTSIMIECRKGPDSEQPPVIVLNKPLKPSSATCTPTATSSDSSADVNPDSPLDDQENNFKVESEQSTSSVKVDDTVQFLKLGSFKKTPEPHIKVEPSDDSVETESKAEPSSESVEPENEEIESDNEIPYILEIPEDDKHPYVFDMPGDLVIDEPDDEVNDSAAIENSSVSNDTNVTEVQSLLKIPTGLVDDTKAENTSSLKMPTSLLHDTKTVNPSLKIPYSLMNAIKTENVPSLKVPTSLLNNATTVNPSLKIPNSLVNEDKTKNTSLLKMPTSLLNDNNKFDNGTVLSSLIDNSILKAVKQEPVSDDDIINLKKSCPIQIVNDTNDTKFIRLPVSASNQPTINKPPPQVTKETPPEPNPQIIKMPLKMNRPNILRSGIKPRANSTENNSNVGDTGNNPVTTAPTTDTNSSPLITLPPGAKVSFTPPIASSPNMGPSSTQPFVTYSSETTTAPSQGLALNTSQIVTMTNPESPGTVLVALPSSAVAGSKLVTLPNQVQQSTQLVTLSNQGGIGGKLILPNQAGTGSKFISLPNQDGTVTKYVAVSNDSGTGTKLFTLPSQTGTNTKFVTVPNQTGTATKLVALPNQTGTGTKFVALPNLTGTATKLVALPNQSGAVTKYAIVPNEDGTGTKLVALANQGAAGTKLVSLPHQAGTVRKLVAFPTQGGTGTKLVTVPNQAGAGTKLLALPNQAEAGTKLVTLPNQTGTTTKLVSLPSQTGTTSQTRTVTQYMAVPIQNGAGTKLVPLPNNIGSGTKFITLPKGAHNPAAKLVRETGTGTNLITIPLQTKSDSSAKFVTLPFTTQSTTQPLSLPKQAPTSQYPVTSTNQVSTTSSQLGKLSSVTTTAPRYLTLTCPSSTGEQQLIGQPQISLINSKTTTSQFIPLTNQNLSGNQLITLSNQVLSGNAQIIKIPAQATSGGKIPIQNLTGTSVVKGNNNVKILPLTEKAMLQLKQQIGKSPQLVPKSALYNSSGQMIITNSVNKPNAGASTGIFEELPESEKWPVSVKSKGKLSNPSIIQASTSSVNKVVSMQSLLHPKDLLRGKIVCKNLTEPQKSQESEQAHEEPMMLKIDSIFSLKDEEVIAKLMKDEEVIANYWKKEMSTSPDKKTESQAQTDCETEVRLNSQGPSPRKREMVTPSMKPVQIQRKGVLSNVNEKNDETEEIDVKPSTSPQSKPIVYARLNKPKPPISPIQMRQYKVHDLTNHFPLAQRSRFLDISRSFRPEMMKSLIKRTCEPKIYAIPRRIDFKDTWKFKYDFLRPRVMLAQIYIPARMKSLNLKQLPLETLKSMKCQRSCVHRWRKMYPNGKKVLPSASQMVFRVTNSGQKTKYVLKDSSNVLISGAAQNRQKDSIGSYRSILPATRERNNIPQSSKRLSQNLDDPLSLACGILQDNSLESNDPLSLACGILQDNSLKRKSSPSLDYWDGRDERDSDGSTDFDAQFLAFKRKREFLQEEMDSQRNSIIH